MSDSSFSQVNTRKKVDITIRFAPKVTRSAVVYMLKYWRDVINFPLLVQATNGNTGNNAANAARDAWQAEYTDDVQRIAVRVFHMLKLKCLQMVVDAWLYQIDNDGDSTSFPVSRVMAASAIDSFKNSRRHMSDMTD